MTDRELLELAAKAAGIVGVYVNNYNGDFYYKGNTSGIEYELPDGGWYVWNPLDDDGDALRLAVKLDIHVLRFSNMTTARAIFSDHCFDERDDGNACAATRRAIVRAAAEIGKAME